VLDGISAPTSQDGDWHMCHDDDPTLNPLLRKITCQAICAIADVALIAMQKAYEGAQYLRDDEQDSYLDALCALNRLQQKMREH